MTGPRRAAPSHAVPVPYVRLLAVFAAAASCGFVFHQAVGLRTLLVPVTIAALLPVLLLLLVRRRLRPLEVTLPLSAVLWLPAAAVTVHGATSPAGVPTAVSDALDAAAQGWGTLLDTPVPTEADPVLTTVPFTLTWLASAAGAELVLRTPGIAGALPGPAAFVCAVAACLPGRGTLVPQALVLVAAATVLLAPGPARAPGAAARRTAVRRRLHAVAWTVPVGAVAFVAVVNLWQPGSAPYDPRDHRASRTRTLTAGHPMARLADWERHPRQELFRASAAPPGRWRWATLSAYDGLQWSPYGPFTTVAGPLPPPDDDTPTPPSDPLRLQVELTGLTGPLLPLPERAFDLAAPTGTAYNRHEHAALAPGEQTRYRVSAVRAEPPAPATLARQAPASGGSHLEQARQTPVTVPAALTELADRTRSAAPSPYGRLTALRNALRDDGYVRLRGAPYAQSTGALARFLEQRRGTAVDFAAAFALAARLHGVPSRIVIGFDTGGQRSTIVAGDARVWAEAALAGAGWVPFDPAPPTTVQDTDHPPPSAAARPDAPSPTPSGQTPTTGETQQSQASGTTPHAPKTAVPWLNVALWSLIGLLALATAVRTATVLVGPALRQRRGRRSPAPTTRVLAAWHEAVEDYRYSGAAPPARSDTYVESARTMAAHRNPATEPAAVALALLASRARYCEPAPAGTGTPPGPGALDATDAELAWLYQESIRAQLLPGRTRARAVLLRLVLPRNARRPKAASDRLPARAARTGEGTHR
ncbi:transglutaminaseTgpA domain-containing protein [Streptomyces sp. NPDC048057]|uniref:transglutaminaseTgpA domain-containing protein n=1 Tax=Streptomyces sp. NPDC048057 TaxID=3155628 RepID=UPI0033F5E540